MLQFHFLNDERKRFPWVPALVLYVASYFMMFFFLDAKFWDDWMVNIQMTPSESHKYWKDMIAMFPTNRFIEISLLHRNPIAMHLLTFVLHFVNGLLVFQILKRVKFIRFSLVAAITLIFLVLPINSARVAMVDFRYTYSLSLFLVGWYLLVQDKSRVLRVFAIAVFVSSFIVQSLLVFFVAPCVHLFIVNYFENGIRKMRALFCSAALFLVAPTYFVLVRLIDPPVSTRTEYYTPSISGSAKGLLLVLVSAFWVFNSFRGTARLDSVNRKQLMSVGAFLVSIGAFAYMAADNLSDISEWMLNFVPRASDWDSRHQLLMGLGISCLIIGLLGDLHSRSKKQLFSVILTVCVVFNFIMMKSYFLDWRKSVGFIAAMSEFQGKPNLDRVMVIDTPSAARFNARAREIRQYEWEVMLSQALNGQKVKVVSSDQVLCWIPDQIIPQTIIEVFATADPNKALITGDVGVSVAVTEMNPCQ
jgi:hypothetical protein